MELKTPKAKKKSSIAKLISWGRMFRTPLLILFLLGTTSCENDSPNDLAPKSNLQNGRGVRHRHSRVNETNRKLSDLKYMRRHLNREIVNFFMTDLLVDGEVENRVHYDGVTAKETYIGDGSSLKLRQLTNGRHLVQIIYNRNGGIQDCDIIEAKSARNFLKTIRKEIKQALDEEIYRISQKSSKIDEDNYSRQFRNVNLTVLRVGEKLPIDVAGWLDYNILKMECIRRHEEMKYLLEENSKDLKAAIRSRRSVRQNLIVPGTKWCGAGQLAEDYSELGDDRIEDRCCRTHDNCRFNIPSFGRRFGYLNFRPYTISHCRCDRRFRACLKLADTSVSNMVGKLFFNVVQTKCFILKPVKTCTQRSWWGKCLRRDYSKQAFLRDNLPY